MPNKTGMIDWETNIADVFEDLSTRKTVNFIITADHSMEKEPMHCRECGCSLGFVITNNLDMVDFECEGCQ